jgi:hypothetical protein
MTKLLRYVWAGPTTLAGLGTAILALPGGRISTVQGVVEAHGPLVSWLLSHATPLGGGVGAVTLGHVVLARDARTLGATRAHERVHVAQYERWGPFFVPAYLTAGLWAFIRGGHPYFDNHFEREALRLSRPAGIAQRWAGGRADG